MTTILNRFNAAYFFSVPPETQIVWFWLACFVFMLVGTIVAYVVFRTKGANLKPYRRYARGFLWPNLTISLIGIVLTLSRYEQLTVFSYRFWVYVTILSAITFNAWFFTVKRGQLEDELIKFHNTARKNKWLKSSKK